MRDERLELRQIKGECVNKNLMTAAAVASGLMGAASAWGQAAPATPQNSGGVFLEEIVVTAQKRRENLQDVPIAVTAITGEALQNSGVGSTIDLGLVTPGLTYAVESGYVLAHVRGVGTTANGSGLENSVATYVDGVYFASMPASLLSLIDVAQVEVLKGPQGTLFGRNATGGLVQITTKDPQSTPGGEADVSYGNYQTAAGDAYLTGPVTSTLGADVAVHALTQHQGFGRNRANGAEVYQTEHDVAARSKWKWTPTESTTATLSFDYESTLGDQFSILKPVPGAASAVPLLGIQVPPLGAYDTDTFLRPFNNLKGGGVSLRLQQDVGFAQLQSITAWRHSSYETVFDPLTTPTPAENFDLKQADNQVSEEVNLTSQSPGRVQWVAGLYYLNATSNAPSTLGFHGPLVNPFFPLGELAFQGKETTDAYAAYAQSTLAVTDVDHLTLGARYSQERRGLENASVQGILTGGIPIGYLTPPYSEDFTNKRPTWRAALDHKFTPTVLGYVSFNTGFKSGGFNSAGSAPFKPEELYAYETGLKVELLDSRLRINSAAFYYDYKDIQVQFFQNSTIAYYNGSGAKLYGFDSDVQARVAPGLTVTGGLALLKDYFSDFPNAVTYTPVPIFGPSGPSFLTSASATGHKLPLAPSATFNVSVDYRHAMAQGIGNLDLTYQHSSNYAFSPDNAFQQPAFNTLNAALSWSTPGEEFMATLWGKNLTDNRVANFITETGFVMLAEYRAPLTYGITLSTRF